LPEVFQRKAEADRRGVAAGVPGVPPMIRSAVVSPAPGSPLDGVKGVLYLLTVLMIEESTI
jgi:hypothetical protein